MAVIPKGTSDEQLAKVHINNFDGGLVTNKGAMFLGSNETGDAVNCMPFQGRLAYAGGYTLWCLLPGKADAAHRFFDTNGTEHWVVWCNGNLYDTKSGTSVLLVSAVYTAGAQVGHVDSNGILYWATRTVPIQKADIAGSSYGPVISSGLPGTVSPPMTEFLTKFNGSIIALAPTISGVYHPTQFIATGTNDVTSWYSTFIQQVGEYDGTKVTYADVLGIANPGVQPLEGFIVFKASLSNVYLYTGAVGSLKEQAIPSPVGIKPSSGSAYCPTPDGYGIHIFIGGDNQIYATDGIRCDTISDNVLPTLPPLIAQQGAQAPTFFFNNIYNEQFQYWYVDTGNNAGFLYKLQEKAWMPIKGWPSGYMFPSIDIAGNAAIFCASSNANTPGVWYIMQPGALMNNVFPVLYYTPPWLHGGNEEQLKDFLWGEICVGSSQTQWQMDFVSAPDAQGNQLSAQSLVFSNIGGMGAGLWDVSQWDASVWAAGFLPSPPQVFHGMIIVPVNPKDTTWYDADAVQHMLTGAMLAKVSVTGGVPAFDLLSFGVRYLDEQGFERVGGALGQANNGGGVTLAAWAPPS